MKESSASSDTASELRLEGGASVQEHETETDSYTVDTSIEAVTSDAVFGEYGRLLVPVEDGSCSGAALGDLRPAWYRILFL